MFDFNLFGFICALAPAALMTASAILACFAGNAEGAWKRFITVAGVGLAASFAALTAVLIAGPAELRSPGLAHTLPAAWLALLVQGLGLVVGAFSARYLQGEAGQPRFISALASVLAAVHVLLLADHWLVLIAAWAAVGVALQKLLCFYADRPFALLAAHKKKIADRIADVLLLAAAALAWSEIGSGSLSDLKSHLATTGGSFALQASAVCLVLAVILRTALLPVHGWLIQVMEAPTPVSALLHAGVVNLGAFVLIRTSPLLEAAPVAQALLILFGLATAALAGLVMLTRVSIKVRLAWSTVAQMGFMLMECGLGLYTLALLHLIGHSLYKAHAFLASSSVVRESKLQALRGAATPTGFSLLAAPLAAGLIVFGTCTLLSASLPNLSIGAFWPWWWTGVLAVAWAPLLWVPATNNSSSRLLAVQTGVGVVLVVGLTLIAALAHLVPLGVSNAVPASDVVGVFVLAGLTCLYLCLAVLQWRPHALEAWRRWSYAGFYVDEFYTRLALRLSPHGWAPPKAHITSMQSMNRAPIGVGD